MNGRLMSSDRRNRLMSVRADVQQGAVLGARNVHVGQGVDGADGSFVGVQHRRARQQFAQMERELLRQSAGRAATVSGGEPTGDVDVGQWLQQVAGAADGQAVRARDQRITADGFRPDSHRRPRSRDRVGTLIPGVPFRGGHRATTRTAFGDPPVLSDLTWRRWVDIDDLPPGPVMLPRALQGGVAAATSTWLDVLCVIGIVDQAPRREERVLLLAGLAARSSSRRPLLRWFLHSRRVRRRRTRGIRQICRPLEFQLDAPLRQRCDYAPQLDLSRPKRSIVHGKLFVRGTVGHDDTPPNSTGRPTLQAEITSHSAHQQRLDQLNSYDAIAASRCMSRFSSSAVTPPQTQGVTTRTAACTRISRAVTSGSFAHCGQSFPDITARQIGVRPALKALEGGCCGR